MTDQNNDSQRVTAPHFFAGVLAEFTETDSALDAVVAAIMAAFKETRMLTRAARIQILDGIATDLENDAGLPRQLAAASEMTTRDMKVEVTRAVSVYRFAAAELRSRGDEAIPVDATEGGAHRVAMMRRVPYGPVLGITPFNSPVLTASHKAAPAIAVGAPILLKPSPWVAHSSALLCERIVRAGWPAKAIASLNISPAATKRLILDPRLPVVSFTGGSFGWELKSWIPRKRVHLELGGVGTVVVHADAPLQYAAKRVAMGAFVRSGQSCISVQAVLVQHDRYDDFVDLLAAEIREVVHGDPLKPEVSVGPLRTPEAVERLQSLIKESVTAGGRVVTGGGVQGRLVEPTLVADVDLESPLFHREAFGPVVAVAPFDDPQEARRHLERLPFGLHVGVFTRDIELALESFDYAPASAVIINDINTWRVDNIPYGGVGESGFGREGVRFAMDEMTQPKLLVINREPWRT